VLTTTRRSEKKVRPLENTGSSAYQTRAQWPPWPLRNHLLELVALVGEPVPERHGHAAHRRQHARGATPSQGEEVEEAGAALTQA